jgi:hypothetical protein
LPDRIRHFIEEGSAELDDEPLYEDLIGEGRVDLLGLVNETLGEDVAGEEGETAYE